MKPTILIVDHRSIFCECLCDFLTGTLTGMQVLSVRNGRQAAELGFLPVACCLVSEDRDLPVLQKAFPNAVLLSVRSGQETETSDPQVPRIMLDMPRNVFAEIVRGAALRGCNGMLDAAPPDAGPETDPNLHAAHAGGAALLSDREREVLKALQRGLPNKLIADELRLSENTVKIHVRNVMRKLGVTNRTMAALCLTVEDPARPSALRGPLTD
ncbi:CsgBAC operon transcriptional regulatory protein [Palleronia abyssalis]|uniref:CsgBAC operon transcriptional regulatory protein n=2 Tax=Palleronia abyssalis TaxID=1501240 RepID=A0A2R8C0N5_9RHOB|nr:CsgBAC operon transcriptional regulatory protein [Palleronia abyssalis]